MMPAIDFATFTFAQPFYLWLLVVPALLLALWGWRAIVRRGDLRRSRRERLVPVVERHGAGGDLAFWPSALIAASLCILALARPEVEMSVVRKASSDLVILQDGSASMYVKDVKPDRWQRSVMFLRALADALSWKGDRVALALFAQVASPQLRLTKDPNALFFFLDHLGDQSPFNLRDNPTWDTNIEEGVSWGLKLVEKDEELFGKTKNPKAFVVVSDGQAWSGEVATALALARDRQIPVHVVGIGTTTGGLIPEPPAQGDAPKTEPVRAVLDRASLQEIARVGGGEYFEIGRESDRAVAFRIVGSVKRRAQVVNEEKSYEPLYWRFLAAAAIVLMLGTLLLKERAELWGHAAVALAAALLLASRLG